MPRFTSIFALLLLILWMPVSLHCAMDQAGWFENAPSCCDEKADQAKADTSSECCAMIDSGMHRLTTTELKAPALNLTTCLPWVAWPHRELMLVPVVFIGATICPPELAATWQFLDRAALPLRAPPAVC